MRRPLLTVLALSALTAAACGYSDPYASSGPVANESPLTASPSPGVDDFNAGAGLPVVKYPDGLKFIDLTVGTGAVVHKGDTVTVQYTGWLFNGTKFDSSRDRGQPFTVPIGQGQVIGGWDEGIPGMMVGGRRKLIIPPALAYGPNGQQDSNGNNIIPPNATLTFIVEMVSVQPGPTPSPVPTPTPSSSPSPSPTK